MSVIDADDDIEDDNDKLFDNVELCDGVLVKVDVIVELNVGFTELDAVIDEEPDKGAVGIEVIDIDGDIDEEIVGDTDGSVNDNLRILLPTESAI